MNSQTPPAPKEGWYELSSDPDVERYWDGQDWTDKVRLKGTSKVSVLDIFSRNKNAKWYLLAGVSLIALLVVLLVTPSQPKSAKEVDLASSNVEGACREILTHDWYELNSREFKHAPDIAARESNAFFVEEYIARSEDYASSEPELFNSLNALASALGDLAYADQFEPAAEAATQVDQAFSEFAALCANYGVKLDAPVLSEATDNKSEISSQAQSKIPEGYIDNGDGIAYKLTPAKTCPPGQYGCTSLEIFAYRDCPRGIKIYGNLFNADGQEVARTDVEAEPVVSGQSTIVLLSTGLSTAVSAAPNSFICQ